MNLKTTTALDFWTTTLILGSTYILVLYLKAAKFPPKCTIPEKEETKKIYLSRDSRKPILEIPLFLFF